MLKKGLKKPCFFQSALMHSLSGRIRTYRHKRKIKSDDIYPSDELKKKKRSPMLFKINTEKSEVTEVCTHAHTVYIYIEPACLIVLCHQ